MFTSPSSVDQEPKATRSGNARIHGMRSVSKASIAYVATQVCRMKSSLVSHWSLAGSICIIVGTVFSRTDLITDSERFYISILDLLSDPEEKEEVDLLLLWWNRQIFPLYTESERLPSTNSALARIRAKRAEHRAAAAEAGAEWL